MPRRLCERVDRILVIVLAAAALAAHAAGVSNCWTITATAMFFGARLVHAVTYAAGITVIRSAVFYACTIATVITAEQVLLRH